MFHRSRVHPFDPPPYVIIAKKERGVIVNNCDKYEASP